MSINPIAAALLGVSLHLRCWRRGVRSLEQEHGPSDPAEPGVAGHLVHHREEPSVLVPDPEADGLEELHPALSVRDGLLDPRVAQPHPPELVAPGIPEQVAQQALEHLDGGGGRGRVGGEVRGGARAGAPRRREAPIEVLGDRELGAERVPAARARDGGRAVCVGAAGGGGDEGREGGEFGGRRGRGCRRWPPIGGRPGVRGSRVRGAGNEVGGGGGGAGAEDVGGALEGGGGPGGGDLLHEILHLVLHHRGRRRRRSKRGCGGEGVGA